MYTAGESAALALIDDDMLATLLFNNDVLPLTLEFDGEPTTTPFAALLATTPLLAAPAAILTLLVVDVSLTTCFREPRVGNSTLASLATKELSTLFVDLPLVFRCDVATGALPTTLDEPAKPVPAAAAAAPETDA